MALGNIGIWRQKNQKLSETEFTSPKDLVAWMGAMQAQDYQMAKWAIGLRIRNATDTLVDEAVNGGQILRTHLMRPTWHFVTSDDIYWMLMLTAPRLRVALKSRKKRLEITPLVERKSNDLIINTISVNGYSTREELTTVFKNAGFSLIDNRAAHLLLIAELEGLICSGPVMNNKPSYALLNDQVPQKKTLTHDEALSKLARRYFSSHGPATVRDFAWWSGLSMKDAAAGIEMIKKDLISRQDEISTYWMSHSTMEEVSDPTVYLLPAYDEFLISYRDRTASIPMEKQRKTISTNGIFYPIIVRKGKVIGKWKRTSNNTELLIEADLFQNPPGRIIKEIEKRASSYGNFLGLNVSLKVRGGLQEGV